MSARSHSRALVTLLMTSLITPSSITTIPRTSGLEPQRRDSLDGNRKTRPMRKRKRVTQMASCFQTSSPAAQTERINCRLMCNSTEPYSSITVVFTSKRALKLDTMVLSIEDERRTKCSEPHSRRFLVELILDGWTHERVEHQTGRQLLIPSLLQSNEKLPSNTRCGHTVLRIYPQNELGGILSPS